MGAGYSNPGSVPSISQSVHCGARHSGLCSSGLSHRCPEEQWAHLRLHQLLQQPLSSRVPQGTRDISEFPSEPHTVYYLSCGFLLAYHVVSHTTCINACVPLPLPRPLEHGALQIQHQHGRHPGKSIARCMHMQRLIESMNNQNVDVLVFPTWSNPPRLIGDYYSCDGEHRLCCFYIGLLACD